ncbi:MAG: hypothetical protein IKO10_18290 [Lachnospiraceae bacterium]|nr:hypothetical protein [Lachnospiraceae bacterium]
MKTTLKFGKIDAEDRGCAINAVDINMELKTKDNGTQVFSASAKVWNGKHSDIIMGGQCIDTLLDELRNQLKEKGVLEEMEEIGRLWKAYHSNDMHAGTPEQEAALKEAGLTKFASDYEKCCEYLKSVGMYEVELEDGTMYKFGCGWLTQPIPEEDLQKIEKIINEGREGLKEIIDSEKEVEMEER